MKYDYLIVGSGLFGSIFAYEATKRNKKCLVIDKRPHVGGNIYTKEVEGIQVHEYGAHISIPQIRRFGTISISLQPLIVTPTLPLPVMAMKSTTCHSI